MLSRHPATERNRKSVVVPALFLASQYGFSGWVDSLVDHSIDYIGEPTGISIFEIMQEAERKHYSNICKYLGRARLREQAVRCEQAVGREQAILFTSGAVIAVDAKERDARRTAVGGAIQFRTSPPLWWLESSFMDFPSIPNSYEDWKAGHADEAGSARNKCIERLILWLAQSTQ
jgi:hypothetical protein